VAAVSGSVQEPARILVQLREGRGWSQAQLARHLKHLAERLGVQRVADAAVPSIKRSIERWEAGTSRPDERYWLLLAHVYAIRDDKVDLGPGSDLDRLLDALALMGVPQRDRDGLRDLVVRATMAGSHAFLAFVTPELQGRLAWALEHPDRLDAKAVEQLQRAVDGLRHQRERSVAMVRLLLALAPLVTALQQLRKGSQPDQVHRALCVVAVQAFTFAGSLSFDLGDPESIRGFYDQADDAAAMLDDGWLAAFSSSSRSMIALHGARDVGAALALADRACGQAAHGSSRIVRARAHAILAEMFAAAGDPRRSERELGLARFHVDGVTGDDPAIGYFTESRHGGVDGMRAHVEGFEGACRIRLGRWKQAESALERAAAGLPVSGADRQRSIILADSALTSLQLGDPGAAADLLGESIGLVAKVGGAVPTRRIHQVHGRFDSAKHQPLVRTLDERLHAAGLPAQQGAG